MILGSDKQFHDSCFGGVRFWVFTSWLYILELLLGEAPLIPMLGPPLDQTYHNIQPLVLHPLRVQRLQKQSPASETLTIKKLRSQKEKLRQASKAEK